MFYILHGLDEFSIAETVGQLKARLTASDPMAAMNFSEMDGRSLTIQQLRATADTVPFFGERRLVVVRGLLGRCNARGGDSQRKALAAEIVGYLPQVADTTRLVLVEERLDRDNPVLRWSAEWLREQPRPDEAGFVREYPAPKVDALPAWISTRASAIGARIEPAAALALADALVRDKEVDLRLAASELEKLAIHAGNRSITVADVTELTSRVSLDNVFRLVDALAARDGATAATDLHRFLAEGETPLRLLSLIARQFRLLAQTRALLDDAVPQAELAGALGVPPFLAGKLARQARHFPAAFLHAALRRLRNIDTEIKTGQVDPVLALDTFIAGVCGAARQPRTR